MLTTSVVSCRVRMQHSHPFALATPPPDSEEFQQMSQSSSGQRFEDLMYHKMTEREVRTYT